MARTVPGSGAQIEPIFDEIFGVRAVKVIDGGSGYDQSNPPRLTITGCGTPDEEALLYPIIESGIGKITHVRVLTRGRGYDPLRLQIIPEQETPNVVTSFNVNRIWQRHPNSLTRGTFQGITDRLRIESDNHPKPSQYIQAEREPGGSTTILDRSFDQVFIYRGGKDVPSPINPRPFQKNKSLGILANGSLLHTPEWGTTGGSPTNFSIDSVKYSYLKNNNEYDAVIDNSVYYHQSSKLINEFARSNSVFEWGKFEVFTWNIIVEYDNILISIQGVDETLGNIEVGRVVDEVGGTFRGEVAKIVRDSQNNVTKVYLRQCTGDPLQANDLILGSNGFQFRVNGNPITFPNGIFYIDFGPDAAEFGPFAPGQYYFAPENIKVQRNYVIVWNQEHISNQPSALHTLGHPMQFSTTRDGTLNGGSLYYNSTGASAAPSTDYENEFKPIFIMNEDENNRIYYFCKVHRYMSGYSGDEGYMVLSDEIEDEPHPNNYYLENYYQSDANDPATIDRSRHPDGHSKIMGMSFDGYPIYGPWGYTSSGTVAREVSGYRLKTTAELDGQRPTVVTPGTVTYTVTVSNGKFLFNGSESPFLLLERGKTYVFNQDDASNNDLYFLVSSTIDGWHQGNPVIIGDTSYLYDGEGFEYYLDGSSTTYSNYIGLFNSSTTREMRFTVPVNAPTLLYSFAYRDADVGVPLSIDGYVLGDFTEDYIYDSTVSGATLDAYNGKFASTPEYPNGTYAYFLCENSTGQPQYPYAIGHRYYSTPLFEGDTVPALADTFPTEATGDVVLTETGQVGYIRMTKKGDNYFGPAKAKILGGQGTGANVVPTVQSVTGLTLLNEGSGYVSGNPILSFIGGGGADAAGSAKAQPSGKIESIRVDDGGEFYQSAPYILITGGSGIGAKAEAVIDQGQVSEIRVTDPGSGYYPVDNNNPEPGRLPNIIFNKLVTLRRKTRARQAFNSAEQYLTGLLTDITADATEVFVKSTDAFPGSGSFVLNTETISYTSKSANKFSGLTRGVNFNYDQRIVLDDGADNAEGISQYKFEVGDRVIRRVESASSKVAKVYDWNPNTRELLVTFEVDELAFIDAGLPSTEDNIVQFDAGAPDSANNQYLPHTVLDAEAGTNSNLFIRLLTEPVSVFTGKVFEDDDELDGVGDGIPDLVNTGTDYENQINLDGGIILGEPGETGRDSKYGIEETVGGQNTTLFQVGDNVKDGNIPFQFATVTTAGGLDSGVPHSGAMSIKVDLVTGNGTNFVIGETVTGSVSGIQATVVSWSPATGILNLNNVQPYNTGDVNLGVNGFLYEFSEKGTIVDFYIQQRGTNYSAAPTVAIEDIGDIRCTGTVNLTAAGDQVDSITITNGGYGYEQTVDGTYALHPTVTFTNDVSDTTGSGVVAYAILGGEKLNGQAGASYRIKSIDYNSIIRS